MSDTALAQTILATDCSPFISTEPKTGLNSLLLLVEGIHCANCIQRIERALKAEPGVVDARVNFTTRRLTVTWEGSQAQGSELAQRVAGLGFGVTPFDPEIARKDSGAEETRLLRELGVAGFAAGNLMTLSIAIWAGVGKEMGSATLSLHYWASALLALPVIVYSGRTFFQSAWDALCNRRVNMDVPIAIGIALTAAMSLFETIRGGEHAYFDAAVSLIFFLLAGRYLDARARGRARAAAAHLLSLAARAATVIHPDGRTETVAIRNLAPGMTLLVGAGEKIAADGMVASGTSDIDMSALSGESLPVATASGTPVFAGTVNMTAPLRVTVTKVGEQTLLAEIIRLMEAAEQGRARYVVLADRAARLYAPLVHGLSLATFIGWMLFGADWQPALLNAVAVLIVTCPCALGLAVPAVQVVASGRLFRRGVLLKSATALERIAEVDTVVFDKTGTLTLGKPELANASDIPLDTLRLAASIAKASCHPLARALAAADSAALALDNVSEQPGCGLEAVVDGVTVRLGNRRWCGVEASGSSYKDGAAEIWMVRFGQAPVRFAFRDRARSDARETVEALKQAGYQVALLSGDRREVAEALAWELGISEWQAEQLPVDKVAALNALSSQGRKVLMVGDGLNDAPALAAAHASLSPSSAADISQVAADAVFQGDRLMPVLETLRVSQGARQLVHQNFALSILYNIVTVPLAMLGYITPLWAAVAMSASSITVVLNALRLQWGGRQ